MTVNFTKNNTSAEVLKEIFQNLDASSCPNYFNFHMHTVYSDGRLQPIHLIEQAIEINLEGFAITDHHTIAGYQAAKNWLDDWRWNHPDRNIPQLWSGVEINANLLDVEVHILGYAFEPEHPSLKPYIQRKIVTGEQYQAINVIRAIHDAGGLAVLAHPVRYKRSHFELIPAAAELGIDGVETFYAYSNPIPWKPSDLQSQQVKKLAYEYSLLNTCGTDTHGLSLLKRL